ncbi:MAG: hypothetical protein JWO80_2212 [Bryobacterales bacterium]|nr:hypothetical protein [Bryobacterales bacterium]
MGVYNMVKSTILRAAEKMPEANYSFKPTPDVRSFGQLIGHIADGQYEFCAPVLGDKTEHPSIEKTVTSKAALVESLKTAFAYCDKAYSAMTDAQGGEIIEFFGHQSPKLTILSFNTAHNDEHYGNIVTYMRLKGLVPPSSEKKQ